MLQDSSSAYRIPDYLNEFQNIFFIKFVHQQDKDLYYSISSNQNTFKTDSVLAKKLSEKKEYTQGKVLSSSHLLKTDHIKPMNKSITKNSEDWFSFSVLVCLLIFSTTRFYYYRRFGQLFSALFIGRVMSQINREGNIKREGITVLLFFFFLLSLSLFIYKTANIYYGLNYNEIYNSFIFFSLIMLFVFLFFFVKLQLIRFIGYVFYTKNETNDYIVLNLVYLSVLGVLLLIPVIIQTYVSFKVGLFLTIGLLLISEAFRIIKAVLSLISHSKFSGLFIFLYLCTVEIIPVMIIYKLLLKFVIT
jgi:hypothetical protein